MKNNFKILAIIIFFITVKGIAQTKFDEGYYYHNGERRNVTINKNRLVVFYNDLTVESTLLGNSIISKRLASSKDGLMGAEIVLDGSIGYKKIIEQIKKDHRVLAVEQVIGSNYPTPLSNLVYVKLKDSKDINILHQVATETHTIVKRPVSSRNWYALEITKESIGFSLDVANFFWESGRFEKVDPGFIFNFSYTCRTDDRYNEQWAIDDTGIDINACDAWGVTTGDNNVIVAVIDQGIDNGHDEFDNVTFTTSYDAEDGTSPAQLHGDHGTHVGGILAANHDLFDIAGVAPNISVMEVSHPLNISATISEELADGIDWAVSRGADILNCSWGDQGGAYYNDLQSSLLEDALDDAIDNGRSGSGCLVVFASGNSSPDIDYPAYYRDEILVVGSIDDDGQRSTFSGYGDELDIVAPGGSILSSIRSNAYDVYDGTSMAAPHASAVAGLILSLNAGLTGDAVTDILESTAQKVGGYSYSLTIGRFNGTWHDEMGYGLLDAFEAVEEAVCGYTIENTTYNNSEITFPWCSSVTMENVNVFNGAILTIPDVNSLVINGTFKATLGTQLSFGH